MQAKKTKYFNTIFWKGRIDCPFLRAPTPSGQTISTPLRRLRPSIFFHSRPDKIWKRRTLTSHHSCRPSCATQAGLSCAPKLDQAAQAASDGLISSNLSAIAQAEQLKATNIFKQVVAQFLSDSVRSRCAARKICGSSCIKEADGKIYHRPHIKFTTENQL